LIIQERRLAAMGDEIDFHLGKRMRRRRRLLGLTQQQLAQACGVRFQQIQKYECGANRVSAARLWRIAGALEVPVDYFFEGLAGQAAAPGPTRDEAADLMRTYHALGERPRRRLLELARSPGRDTDAA
jgi:transcriptional regulator with XRE-family HTH domain